MHDMLEIASETHHYAELMYQINTMNIFYNFNYLPIYLCMHTEIFLSF